MTQRWYNIKTKMAFYKDKKTKDYWRKFTIKKYINKKDINKSNKASFLLSYIFSK